MGIRLFPGACFEGEAGEVRIQNLSVAVDPDGPPVTWVEYWYKSPAMELGRVKSNCLAFFLDEILGPAAKAVETLKEGPL